MNIIHHKVLLHVLLLHMSIYKNLLAFVMHPCQQSWEFMFSCYFNMPIRYHLECTKGIN